MPARSIAPSATGAIVKDVAHGGSGRYMRLEDIFVGSHGTESALFGFDSVSVRDPLTHAAALLRAGLRREPPTGRQLAGQRRIVSECRTGRSSWAVGVDVDWSCSDG